MQRSIGEYLTVERAASTGKTCRWAVNNKTQAAQLGVIQWNTGWRQYVFHPNDDTSYSAGCMRDIAAFCEANRKTRVEDTDVIPAE